jgi:hypothetical protein
VTELVKLVGLPGSEDKYPAQLSGGQQQRIALARALATSPGLLLLDEPLSALDAIVRVHLRGEIRSLQRKLGVTTIMVTHDQEEALSVADRIVVMNHGVIEQVGTPMEVYREPATPFVADFVGRINVLPARREAGGLRVGRTCVATARTATPAGANVRVYLRPEDVLARPIAPGDSNVFDALIEKIEFLGSYCLVRVAAARPGRAPAHRLPVAQLPGRARSWRWAAACRCACCRSACGCSRERAWPLQGQRSHAAGGSAARAAGLYEHGALPGDRAAPACALDRSGWRTRGDGGGGAGPAGLPGRAAAAILLQALQDKRRARFVGLANFVAYAQTPALLQSLWNSLWVSPAGHRLHRAHGLRFAYALTRSCMRFKACSAASRWCRCWRRRCCRPSR